LALVVLVVLVHQQLTEAVGMELMVGVLHLVLYYLALAVAVAVAVLELPLMLVVLEVVVVVF